MSGISAWIGYATATRPPSASVGPEGVESAGGKAVAGSGRIDKLPAGIPSLNLWGYEA